MKTALLCAAFCFFIYDSTAQQYLIYFKDKASNTHSLSNPQTFLSQRALERRTRYGIGLDSTDLPVTAAYTDSLRCMPGVQVRNASRWMNAVSIELANPGVLDQINRLPFVAQSQKVGSRIAGRKRKTKPLPGKIFTAKIPVKSYKPAGTEPLRYGRATAQIALHKGSFLHNIGLQGQEMMIGVLDACFYHYATLPAFDSARISGRILGSWDFVAGEAGVAEDDAHGMHCFSIMAANMPGKLIGTAPAAFFYLFRSEDAASEKLVEEHNWVCAAERLDSAGGDVISSSLGYDEFDNRADDHTYQSLDGSTTIVARGAGMAASKGMLVVNAAGNSGEESWRYINTPADGDSVLAVGAADNRGATAAFSSYGPTADGRIKPDVVSMGVGTFVQATNGRITSGDGTSFATPNIAGLAACLWQGFREVPNIKIIEALRLSANKAQRPDEQSGYGVPDMQKATVILLKQYAQANATAQNCRVHLNWKSKDMVAMKYIIERKSSDEKTFAQVATIAGTGGVFGNRSYTWTDAPFRGGTIEYRIKQWLDTTASVALYIDTVSVLLPANCVSQNSFRLVPNPVVGEFVMNAAFEENVWLVQQMNISKWNKPNCKAQFYAKTKYLSAGKYGAQLYRKEASVTTLKFPKL